MTGEGSAEPKVSEEVAEEAKDYSERLYAAGLRPGVTPTQRRVSIRWS